MREGSLHTGGDRDAEYDSRKLVPVVSMIHLIGQAHHLIDNDTAVSTQENYPVILTQPSALRDSVISF